MRRSAAVLAALVLWGSSLSLAQTPSLGQALLSGTTAGRPWSLYAAGLSRAALLEDSPRLRIGVPTGASILGSRYDAARQTLLLTYRLPGGLDARSALALATNQLQLQGFDLAERTFPEAGRARATLTQDGQTIEVQATRRPNGDLQVTYGFSAATP